MSHQNSKMHSLCDGNTKKLCTQDCDWCHSRSFASHEKSVFWSKNNNGVPRDYLMKSGKKCFFDCKECGHEIEITLANVVTGYWCGYCKNKALCQDLGCNFCLKKSFASHPKANFWLPENGTIPRMAFLNSKAVYKFKCGECNHSFECPLQNLTTMKNSCMYCSGQKICFDEECKKCFGVSFASHPKSAFWSSNNDVKPREIFKTSDNKYLFDCEVCGHEFEASVYNVQSMKGCAYCNKGKLCSNKGCKLCSDKIKVNEEERDLRLKNLGEKSLRISTKTITSDQVTKEVCSEIPREPPKANPLCNATSMKLCSQECDLCYSLSFARHPKSKFWSKTNACTPRDVLLRSNKKFDFDCECGHSFKAALGNVTVGKWCVYCTNQKLCSDDKCQTCFDKSFASHPKSAFWSRTNEKKPREVFKGSRAKCFFDCRCGHIFLTTLCDIARGGWCLYCCNQKLCSDNECKVCFEKSAASVKKSKYWSDKNQTTPREVFKGNSKDKYIYNCKHCKEEYSSIPKHVTNGHWCGCTINKTETKLHKWLQTSFPDCMFERQKKFGWCKKKACLPLDFYCEDLKLVIELDGPQHFEQVRNWETPKEIHETDLHKMKVVNEHNIHVIRIYQPDVWKENFDWKNKLKAAIETTDGKNLLIGKPYCVEEWQTGVVISELFTDPS